MSKNELISVLVPVYNVERFIGKCAESLFSQTYRNLQFIFVNDASTDQSLQVLRSRIDKYPDRSESVMVITNECNRGLSEARNIALSHALGEYIIHVDGDDFLEPYAIQKLYELALNTNADVVIGDFVFDFKTYSKPYIHTNYSNKRDYLLGLIRRKVPCCIWGKLIRKSLIVENNITSIKGVSFGEDFVVIVRLIDQARKISFLNEVIYHYVKTNQNSITATIDETSIRDLLVVNKVLCSYFGKNQFINNQIKLYTKLLLFKQVSSKKLLKTTAKLYPEIKDSSLIPIRDKIIMKLAETSSFSLIILLNSTYKILAKILWRLDFRNLLEKER